MRWLSALAVGLAVLIGGLWLLRPAEPEPAFTWLDGVLAPTFRLMDHRGVEIGLDDYRGKAVVLAFIYTSCPDVCKLTAAGLRQTVDLLGADAAGVQLMAVTVDPSGDDASSVEQFLGRYNLTGRMVYLTGPPAALPAVWESYFLYVDSAQAQRPKPQNDAHAAAHTDALYLIDRSGRERALLHSDFDPTELAGALRQILAERA